MSDFKAGDYVLHNWNGQKVPAFIMAVHGDKANCNTADCKMDGRGGNLKTFRLDDLEPATLPMPAPEFCQKSMDIMTDPLWAHMHEKHNPPLAASHDEVLALRAVAEKETMLPGHGK